MSVRVMGGFDPLCIVKVHPAWTDCNFSRPNHSKSKWLSVRWRAPFTAWAWILAAEANYSAAGFDGSRQRSQWDSVHV